ncbi:MAG TPA: LysR family transcriptional regulator [Bryobacteraceae bacterium]|nr:LysR family transcriptional regulator [Bryobacteraceae bacterium]
MEIHQLRYFCSVARNGTFTRAAEAERVAQPSLSQQILKLEAELGAKLFDRLSRSARLTEFGRAFLPNAERILREISEAKTEILEMSGKDKGEISIGAIPTVAPYLLPTVLSTFSRQHAGIAVNVIEDTTPVLLQQLHAGSVDLIVTALPLEGVDLLSIKLLEEPFFLVVPQSHPLARRKIIKLEDIPRKSRFLLLKEGHCFRDSTIAACKKSRIVPNVVFESGQFATILAMVASGMGISAVPKMAVQPARGCRFIRLANNGATRVLGATMLGRHFQTRAQRVFLQHLLYTVREAVKNGSYLGPFGSLEDSRADG